ncbi:MAG: hypothetical protein RBJ76_13535 [Stenomitos frigidus ULC029]
MCETPHPSKRISKMACLSLDQFLLEEIAALVPTLLAEELRTCIGTLSGHFFIIRSGNKKAFDLLQRHQRLLVNAIHKRLPAVVMVTLSYGTVDVDIPVYFITKNWLPPVTPTQVIRKIHKEFLQDHVPGCITLATGTLLFANASFLDRFPTLEIGHCVSSVHLSRSLFLPNVLLNHRALMTSEVLLNQKVASVRVNGRLLFNKGQLMIASSVYT